MVLLLDIITSPPAVLVSCPVRSDRVSGFRPRRCARFE
jgi:hypothetical protein